MEGGGGVGLHERAIARGRGAGAWSGGLKAVCQEGSGSQSPLGSTAHRSDCFEIKAAGSGRQCRACHQCNKSKRTRLDMSVVRYTVLSYNLSH